MKKISCFLFSIGSITCAFANEITVSGHKLDLTSFVDSQGIANYVAWRDKYMCLNCLAYKGGIFTNIPTNADALIFIYTDKTYPNIGWTMQVAKKGTSLLKNKAKSTLSTIEFNCSSGKYRTVAISAYSSYFRQGKTLFQKSLTEPWKYPNPDGAMIILKDYVCSQ